MALFLILGAVLAYIELSALIAWAGDALARWHAKRDKWGM
jgi:hypothetical protein